MALQKASTTAIGKAFERHSIKFLNHHLSMCVREVGGANDGGVDIRGWWFVPSGARRTLPQSRPYKAGGTLGEMKNWEDEMRDMRESLAGWGKGAKVQYDPTKGFDPDWTDGRETEGVWNRKNALGHGVEEDSEGMRRLRVVGQCKAEGKPVGTRYIRELEGVMSHFHGREAEMEPHQYDLTGRRLDRLAPSTVAILISRSGFTSNATVRAWRSPSPIMLVHLPGGSVVDPNERDDGVGPEGIGMRVNGVWLNPALSGLKGLLGGTVEIRREILPAGPLVGDGKDAQAPKDQWRVWYNGKRVGRVGPTIEEVIASTL